MKIALTPGQAVTVHGWWRARQSLCWSDVLSNPALTFDALLSYNITEQDLYVLQPDLRAWIQTGRAYLQDCPRMRMWDAHPIKDFKADLADIVAAHWPVDVLSRMGVTYQDLVELGLTPETMNLFNFTLMMWSTLGFRRQHAEAIAPSTLFRLFSMSKQDILPGLK